MKISVSINSTGVNLGTNGPSASINNSSSPKCNAVIQNGSKVVLSYTGIQGPIGPQGPAGNDGAAEYFETVSKNLKSFPYALNYTVNVLTSIVYTVDAGTITKTLNYTGNKLTSIVLSGNTPSGIDLTKTLNYTGDALTSVTYS